MKEFLDLVSAYLTPIFISISSIIARVLFEGNRPSIMHLLRTLFIGIFVGGLTGELVAGSSLGPGWQGVIIAVSAMISDDILSVIIAAGGRLREDPVACLKELFPWYRKFK